MPKFNLDFIGIGAEKSASSWIADCLKQHPEVCFSSVKEIFFFNEFDPHLLTVKNLKYKRGISWYKRHFDLCSEGLLKGEYSPTYLYCKKAANRIKKHFPDIKIVVCLRDPSERAFSQYLHDKGIGLIKDISFEETLKEHSSYFEKGLYYKYLSYYFKLFSRNQFLILFIEDIKDNPKKEVKRLYKHLGLKNINYIPKSLNKRSNVASSAKFHFLNYLLIHTEYFIKKNKLMTLHKILENTGIRKFAYNFNVFVNRKPLKRYPKMKKSTQIMLREYYKSDIAKLEKLLNKDLSAWKKLD